MNQQIPPDCPIAHDCNRINSLSNDLRKAIRQLRAHLRQCPKCPAFEDCPLRAQVNFMLQSEIQAINDEWNLASLIIHTT